MSRLDRLPVKGLIAHVPAFRILLLTAIPFSCRDQTPQPQLSTYTQAIGSAWHLAFGQADDDETAELFYATYEGYVACLDTDTQKTLFTYNLGAFPFSLVVVDLDGDGIDEALVATAEGELLAIDRKGQLRWSFSSTMAFFSVAAGHLTPGDRPQVAVGGLDRTLYLLDHEGNLIASLPGAQRLVHRLAIGNLHAGAGEEILMIENRTIASVIRFENGKLTVLNRKSLNLSSEYANWENPGAQFYVFDLVLADLNQDGIDEVVAGDSYFNNQIVGAFDTTLSLLWVSKELPSFSFGGDPDRFTEFYSTAFVQASDLLPDHPGLEVASVAGNLVRVFDSQGTLVGEAHAKVGFADLAVHDRELVLGSSPNGDRTLYRIDFSHDWKNQINALERQGVAATVEKNLMRVREQVLAFPAPATSSEQIYTFRIGGVSRRRQQGFSAEREWMQRHFPYSNFRYITNMKVIEPTPPLDEKGNPWAMDRWRVDAINGTIPVEYIIQRAQWIESQQIPTLFYIGHSCMPFITLETAEKILQAAPEYCVGFVTYEDEQIERIPRYFEHFYKPLAELCLKYGRKLNMTKNKGIWWISSPALPEVHDALFGGERYTISGASTEDSNSRTPEMNILGRSGLWLAGLTDHLYVNANSDLFSFNRFFQWEYPRHGHPYFRRLVAHTLLGGSMFDIRYMDKMPTDSGFVFSQMGRESAEIFYHMLGKDILMKPEREQVRGFNPIGFAVHPPSRAWLADAHNGHNPETWRDSEELNQAIIPHNGAAWGMTNTPAHALQHILFHKERQFGCNIPATPYGLVAFVPAQADRTNVPGIKEWWHTDGTYIWKEDGKKYTGAEAAQLLQQDFSRAASELLFRYEGDDVFLQTLEVSPGVFRLYLIDPGWLDPADRTVTIIPKFSQRQQVKDLLSGEDLQTDDAGRFEITVPAGAIRIVEVKK